MVSCLQHRDLKEAPFLLVLLVETLAIGYAMAAPEHWLRAVGVMAGGLSVAGVLRLVLTDDQAGLLRVRRRVFDVACYFALAVATLVFALALPQR
jgi:hypothetical protein